MKKWWTANILWIIFFVALYTFMLTYPCSENEVILYNFSTVILLISSITIVYHFQHAWYLWLQGRIHDMKKANQHTKLS